MTNKEKINLADLDTVIEAVRRLRKDFVISAQRIKEDLEHYEHYTEVALEIRRNFFNTYGVFPLQVPVPQDAGFIRENDWVYLERWFLGIQDIEIEIRAKASKIARKSKAPVPLRTTATPPQIPTGETPVRIETAIEKLKISHSRVKQAAKNGDIQSERAGAKKNSAYLVFKSEVENKFGAHGVK